MIGPVASYQDLMVLMVSRNLHVLDLITERYFQIPFYMYTKTRYQHFLVLFHTAAQSDTFKILTVNLFNQMGE